MSFKRKRWKAPDFLYAEDLMMMTGLGRTKCSAIIRRFNAELEERGYFTIRGRVPREYVITRFYGFDERYGDD